MEKPKTSSIPDRTRDDHTATLIQVFLFYGAFPTFLDRGMPVAARCRRVVN
jgi:hypothetical protein